MVDRIDFVSVIVLTKNEEAGLGKTLSALRDFSDVIVVDSHSDDRTVDIALQSGARVVQFEWDGKYPKKKQWSIDHADASNAWVLLLDADEYPSTGLINEIRELRVELSAESKGAYDIQLRYRFAGTFLRHGHRVTKRSLLNSNLARFPTINDLAAPGIREVEGHYQPTSSRGLGTLHNQLLHDDVDPVSSWFARHNRYSDWEAHLAMDPDTRREVASKRTNKGRIFDLVPFKSLTFFIYAYIARAGFLDGRAGLDYALALAMYYWQIGVKTRELKRQSGVQDA